MKGKRYGSEVVITSCLLLIICAFTIASDADYLKKRDEFLKEEAKMNIGGDIVLEGDEVTANNILMKRKRHEFNESRHGPRNFPPSIHFFKARPLIEQSAVFEIIKLMPKGGDLHIHDVSIVDLNWLVKNVTYRDHCYMCYKTSDNSIQFHFFGNPPANPECPWRLVSANRQAAPTVAAFDQSLYNAMSMVVPDPTTAYPTENDVWKHFSSKLSVAIGLIFYAPVYRDYYYEALKEFVDDNVQYIELRALLGKVYELDGSTHDKFWVTELYQNTTNEFLHDHPDFFGAKIIQTSIRRFSVESILDDVKIALELRKRFPNFMLGFDLVAQEDRGNSLLYYIDDLLYPSRLNPPVYLPYYFHAGETNWEGTSVDDNLLDAILLNTTRIGHGYGIDKHPEVMKKVKEKGIAIEVCPISNQVLKLVDDLRNHPAAVLISEDYPVVIASDDNSVWQAVGLSHDYYEAFMGMVGEEGDLRVLKKLAINSIAYSGMEINEKMKAFVHWEKLWVKFIKNVIQLKH